jgi:diguanylate cyclase (GGDEF)-like protein
MVAAARAVKAAIAGAASPTELFGKFARAVVVPGEIGCVGVLIAGADGGLRLVASAGAGLARLKALEARPDQAATRSRRGAGAAAVVPLRRGGVRVGALAFCPGRPEGFDKRTVDFFCLAARGVSRALDRFDRGSERTRRVQSLARQGRQETITRMFQALGATNEAIMRARSRDELFEMVCKAAVTGGDFTSTLVAVAEAQSEFLRIAAAAGPTAALASRRKLAISADRPEGRGLCGTTFRSGRAFVTNDYYADIKETVYHGAVREEGARAGAALPLIVRGATVGVLLFLSRKRGAFTSELVELLQSLAENISFALENFEREDERRRAEEQKERLTHLFAVLSATNEAIVRARTRAELFSLVCEAAAHGGRFNSTVIALVDPGTDLLRVVATGGPNGDRLKSLKLSTNPAVPEGRGLTGTAFRTGEPCISNDYLADARTAVFHDEARALGYGSCAALPLLSRGKPVGVMEVISGERGAFSDDLVALIRRLSDNISFALENFDREDERRRAEEQKVRLARMYAALSATNEAIMRSRSRKDLFARVCRAAVKGGKFALVTIALQETGTAFLREAARAGAAVIARDSVRVSTAADQPKGRGLSGTAFRTRAPCISNDYLADERGAAFHVQARARGLRSYAALPLLCDGEAVGVLTFGAREKSVFTPELVELLQRLAENVSFALENFDRADERRFASEQKERLGRMFVALSATNEAIMRASTRDELFQLVCEAAVQGGRFASTIVALKTQRSAFLSVVASAGPKRDMQKTVKISISEDHRAGQGVSGTAFRTLQPCIINDYLADPRGAAFHRRAQREGNRSGAALPLLSHGQAVGVLVFMSSEVDAFTPELVELLARLANNVSFALENFDRAEEKARADERIKYLATHDGLTGLPNRAMFTQLLRAAIESAREHDHGFAVLFIDIDRLKVINDSLGHDAGDALLVETGERLRNCLGARDVVARLGGDEFVVILQHAAEPREIEGKARRLLAAICEPLQLRGLECRATASIGIAVFPGDGEDELSLTKNADMAMYRAKEEGKNGFRFFINHSKTPSMERLVFEARLRQALDRGELSLHYQPKVEAATNRITGVEALLRWTLPDLGLLPPMQFIPLAEETGLIVPIGRWVLKTACAQNMAWRRLGAPPMSMAVNLSPRQFSDDNLLDDIDSALGASGMPAELLQLEITESMMMRNVGRAIELLDVIRSRGVRLAIDDFGTGYSSMSLMKKFPVDTIKIDRSFVQDLPHDVEDRAIAQAIISMGKALGLTVVAEGVETAEQAAFLRAHGCDEMQGYFFSKPVEAERVPDLLGAARFLTPSLRAIVGLAGATPGRKSAGRTRPGRSGARSA